MVLHEADDSRGSIWDLCCSDSQSARDGAVQTGVSGGRRKDAALSYATGILISVSPL